jgi:hypothetical protein
VFSHADTFSVPDEVDLIAEERPAYVATVPAGGALGVVLAWVLPGSAPAPLASSSPVGGADPDRGGRGDRRPRRAGGARRRRPSSRRASERGSPT